jgi:hypothetical protein
VIVAPNWSLCYQPGPGSDRLDLVWLQLYSSLMERERGDGEDTKC